MDINPTLAGSYEILLSSVLVVMMYSCARLSLLFLGYLIVSLYQQGDSSLLSHVHLSDPKPVWNTLSICPTSLTNDQNTEEKLLSVLGTGSGLSFTVQIAEGASEIALDEPHIVNVQGDEVSIFQFKPPPGISDKQLDITATSQSTVAAYLKVSKNCKEVDLQKDLENIDYKKESLRLSFATKGRITLSRASIPPLTDSVSRWFIGIGLKNVSGDVKLRVSKNITLKLTRSFDYNYLTPICILYFVSVVIGILVSIVAYFLFEESLTKVKVGKGKQGNDNVDLKVSVCEMWELIRYHWFSSTPKTFSFTTGIVGNVLMVGASQFVFVNWYRMIEEGDRDNCYYNDFCYRVASHDIPFNLILTNLTYIVHGLILVVWVLMLETKVYLRYRNSRPSVVAEGIRVRNVFSIGYALSCALVFQGLFSALCHLCPNMFTFQFEVVLLFIIAGLSVLLLYNGIEQDPFQNEKYQVDAPNFFLYFIVPLSSFNYCSELLNWNPGLKKKMQWLVYILLIFWWCKISFFAFHKLNMRQNFISGDVKDIFNAFLFILGPQLMLGTIFMYHSFSDLTQSFQLTYFTCSAVAIVTRVFLPKFSKRSFGELHVKGILQNLFISFTVIISFAAVCVFKLLPTTNKTSSPENSRDQNQECVILGFFDWHALGHLLFSFALLMSAFALMFIGSEAEESPQAEIMSQEHKGKKRV